MAEAASHEGSCHCGAVKFAVKADISKATSCNCSNCQRLGWMLAFVPEADFTLRTPEAPLTDYQFHHKRLHHLFCPTCGVHPFSRGAGTKGPMVAVNLRCLEDVDLTKIEVTLFDGRKL